MPNSSDKSKIIKLRDDWLTLIYRSVAGLDPFALGDPPVVESILERAGFVDVTFTDVHEPVSYGPDAASATEMVLGLRGTENMLATLDPQTRELAVGRLRTLIAAHHADRGVLFDSRAWIITARRPAARGERR